MSNDKMLKSLEELIERLSLYYEQISELERSHTDPNIISYNLSILSAILPSVGDGEACSCALKNKKISQVDRIMYETDKEYYKLSVKSSTNHQQNIAGKDETEVYIKLHDQYRNLYYDIKTQIESCRSLLKNIHVQIENGVLNAPSIYNK